MKQLLSWWPAFACWFWLGFIQAVAGWPACFFSGVSMLAVCLLALYEVGAAEAQRGLGMETKP